MTPPIEPAWLLAGALIAILVGTFAAIASELWPVTIGVYQALGLL